MARRGRAHDDASVRKACAALCIVLAACGADQQSISCTAIACINGLGVIVTNPPQGAFSVEAIAPGEAAPHVVTCSSSDCGFAPVMPAPGGTGRAAFFANYFPDNVAISIVDVAGNRTTYNKTATYTLSFPNGPQCDIGGCRSAVVTVP